MKTWQRILIVTVLLAIGVAVGFKKALLEDERNIAVHNWSTSNLHQIGLGVLVYADDWDSRFPDLSDAQSMKQALVAYISTDKSKAEKAFVYPKTGKPYQPNSSLTYKERKGPNASADIAVVYEDEPAGDGRRGVLFGDCHVERVTESRWLELKKSSNIP